MSLSSGTKLGPYEIIDAIGAGGMGEVYKARDTRLERIVAVKVLPAHVADRPDFRQRFEREARAVSSLNHPHICTLHDIGQQDGIDFLVMEYLEGETLGARLSKGILPMEQVLRYAIEIAEALAQAHKQGVFHRDLKPGNIMITKAGAKLLDFGLAKLKQSAAPGSLSQIPTELGELTQKGTILGTFQYMPPEQLDGKETDARGDIFAFGAVLYEVATGRKAFQGQSHASLIAAIMHSQPAPVSSVQPMTPPALDYVVQKCLAKDPDERWQSAQDLAAQLKWIAGSIAPVTPLPGAATVSTVTSPALATTRAAGRSLPIGWAAAAVLLLSTVVLTVIHFREAPPKVRAVRFQIAPPEKIAFRSFDMPVISPDGERLAFTGVTPDGKSALWVRSLDSLTTQALPGTEGAALPFWSPDGRSLGFYANGKLQRTDAAGGPVQTLANPQGAAGGAWNRDGVILFSSGGGGTPLYRIAAVGGEAKPATALDASKEEILHLWPQFFPDGRHFLYLAVSRQTNSGGTVYIGSLDSKQVTRLSLPAGNVAYANGHIVFPRGDILMTQRFDLKKLELSGEPVPVAEQVAAATPTVPGAVFSVSENGVLAYRSGGGFAKTQLVWFDRTGKQFGSAGEPAIYSNPALSPDEKKLAVGVRNPQDKARDIWVFDLTRGTSSRLTFDPGDDLNPAWSPDGTHIAFTSDRKGHRDLYQKLASGAGQEELLLESESDKNVEDWSADSRFVLYNTSNSKTASDLWVLPLSGDRKPLPVIEQPFGQSQAQISRDGRWIAYASGESGRSEVYVQPFPPGGAPGKWQISTAGGSEPQWRRDSKELFYFAEARLMAVEIKTRGATLEAGIPKPLFEARLSQPLRNRYVVTGDGKRFLVNVQTEGTTAAPMIVVLNWPSAIRQ